MSIYEGIDEVVEVSSDSSGPCKYCTEYNAHFADTINHYIQVHGLKILHIGEEGSGGGDYPEFRTVAILGI